MPSKLLRVRTAAVAVLSLGGVAAAAGLAPTAAERATPATPGTPGGQAASAHGNAATLMHGPDTTTAATSSAGRSSDHATGPDASGAAKRGLCRAWLAGQGDDHGRRADAPAFQALAAAAGGADHIADYCEADASASATHRQRPAAPPGKGQVKTSPPTTGPPNGNGNGQDGPPTTA